MQAKNNMSKISKIVYLFISVVFFVLFDLFLSETIIAKADLITENPVLNIVFVQNQGAAFNILNGCKSFLIAFSAAAVICLIVYAIRHIERMSVFMLFFTSMLVAGIFSNMLERLMFGFVRDYIKLVFVDFPVFNISDIFINIGVISIIFIMLKRSYLK